MQSATAAELLGHTTSLPEKLSCGNWLPVKTSQKRICVHHRCEKPKHVYTKELLVRTTPAACKVTTPDYNWLLATGISCNRCAYAVVEYEHAKDHEPQRT